MNEKIKALETKYDSKLSVYTESLETKFRHELKEAKKVMKNKFRSLQDEVFELKTSLHDEIEYIIRSLPH